MRKDYAKTKLRPKVTKSNLEVDSLKDLVRRVQLQEQHDEDAMVGDLDDHLGEISSKSFEVE